MKKIFIILSVVVLFYSCKEEPKVDAKYVIAKFQENADKINALEYRMQRIDTFDQDGAVFNNTGFALIEKDKNDKVFGFSFYGKRDDVPEEYIYDAGKGFEIFRADKSYKTYPGQFGLIGTPGGQMVHANIFKLDSIYKNVSLSETENAYLLTFEFENDTVYYLSEKKKIFQLNKTDFFPDLIKYTYTRLGKKLVSISKFSDVKINEKVTHSIKDFKQEIHDYSVVLPKKRKPSKLLLKPLPELELPDLLDQNKLVKVNNNKLTLIEFWEVWCAPCIASFPRVENLKNQFSTELNIIGIVSEDYENAVKLVKKKGITFQNLVGNSDLEKEFGVRSWPRYFLVDNRGIVQKDYYGFSSQIEKDIKKLIANQNVAR